MRIFTRYILREVISYALLGGVLFTFVLFMRDLGKILDLVVRDSASLTDVVRIFALHASQHPHLHHPHRRPRRHPPRPLPPRRRLRNHRHARLRHGRSRLRPHRLHPLRRRLGLGLRQRPLLRPPRRAATSSTSKTASNPRKPPSKSSPASSTRTSKTTSSTSRTSAPPPAPPSGTTSSSPTSPSPRPHTSPPPTRPSSSTARAPQSAGSQHAPPQNLHPPPPHQRRPAPHLPHRPQPIRHLHLRHHRPPLQIDSQDDTHLSRINTPLLSLSLSELWPPRRATPPHPDRRPHLTHRVQHPLLLPLRLPRPHAHRRPARPLLQARRQEHRLRPHPPARLRLLLPLHRRRLRQIRQALPFLGVWGANLIFAAFGPPPLPDVPRRHRPQLLPRRIGQGLNKLITRFAAKGTDPRLQPPSASTSPPSSAACAASSAPASLCCSTSTSCAPTPPTSSLLAAFALLYVIFTFFELIGDIIRNQTPFVIVGEYLINLIPYIISNVTPLCSLLAVLITFGSLNRTSELTAMKATGISLYRVVAPILVLARSSRRRPLRLRRVSTSPKPTAVRSSSAP